MTEILQMNVEGFNHLLMALLKTRSNAVESGCFDLLGPSKDLGMKGLERWVGDDRTVDLLSSLADEKRPCDHALWLNLTNMVKLSPGWGVCLAAREVRMPTPAEAFAELAAYAKGKSSP